MSDRLFSRWLPVPAMARPRRPLSMSASHASWSIRFSLRMIDLRGAELQQPLEPVVAVDDAPVEVVEVGGGEPAAVELDHGPQVGRDDRQHREDHPLGARAAAAERLDEAQSLDRLLAAHAGGGADLAVELRGEPFEVHAHDQLTDGLGAHARAEETRRATHAAAVLAVELAEVHAVERDLGQEHAGLKASDLILRLADLLAEALGLALEAIALRLERGVHLEAEVVDLALDAGLFLRLLALDVGVELLDRLGSRLAQPAERVLVGLVALGDDDLVGEPDGGRRGAAAERGDAQPPRPAAASTSWEVRAERRSSDSALNALEAVVQLIRPAMHDPSGACPRGPRAPCRCGRRGPPPPPRAAGAAARARPRRPR